MGLYLSIAVLTERWYFRSTRLLARALTEAIPTLLIFDGQIRTIQRNFTRARTGANNQEALMIAGLGP